MKPKKISIDYWMRLYRRDRDDGKMSECRHLIPPTKGCKTGKSSCQRCPFGDGASLNNVSADVLLNDPCAMVRYKHFVTGKKTWNTLSFEQMADHFYDLENQKRNIKIIEGL